MAKLSMFRGDYREFKATVTDTYNAASKMHFAVKTKANISPIDAVDSDAVFVVDATSANAVNNGNGTVTYTLVIDASKTTGKTPGTYVAEIEYIDATNKHTTFKPQIEFELLGDINQRV